MSLSYDMPGYIANVKMSSKKRILVEGRDDKTHITNLLNSFNENHRVKIDTAERISGDCQKTSKNNRAKIEKVFDISKNTSGLDNLYYLCDREFDGFEVNSSILDFMVDDEDSNFSFTDGHSFENYFFMDDVVCQAYRYICKSEYKNKAERLYKNIFPSAIRIISALTLSAKSISKLSYPTGVITWKSFHIEDGDLFFNIEEWKAENENDVATEFYNAYKEYLFVVESSDIQVCSKICRGHTAMVLLQRVFSACLRYVAADLDDTESSKLAEEFARIKESSLSTALCQAWIERVVKGEATYPRKLMNCIA